MDARCRTLFYNHIIKLVRGRDQAEELRADLTRSGLARTTIMTCYGPSQLADCGARDCLITFVSCPPYHHWDVEWAWPGDGPPPEGFGATGTAWEHSHS